MSEAERLAHALVAVREVQEELENIQTAVRAGISRIEVIAQSLTQEQLYA